MDSELLLWVIVFVGGYSLVVAWLLSIALRKKGGEVGDASGPPGGGGSGGHGRGPGHQPPGGGGDLGPGGGSAGQTPGDGSAGKASGGSGPDGTPAT